MIEVDAPPSRDKLRRLDSALLRMKLRLAPADMPLLDAGEPPRRLLDQLVERKLLVEACRLLAYALPAREGVWWSCMCVAHAAPTDLAETERAALDAAEAWVRRTEDDTRREAAWAAAAAGYHLPGSWSALAAYWSRPAEPQDLRGGRGVETAIDRAILRAGSTRKAASLANFIASGRDIAMGGAGRLPAVAEE